MPRVSNICGCVVLYSLGRGGRRRDYEEPPEDPAAPRDMEEEDFVPDVELPPLTMQLKSRDHGSITFIYDVDIEAITVLNTIRQPKNKSKVREPLYQFEHRLCMSRSKGTDEPVEGGEGRAQEAVGADLRQHLNRWWYVAALLLDPCLSNPRPSVPPLTLSVCACLTVAKARRACVAPR
jgi:hypothetical protein